MGGGHGTGGRGGHSSEVDCVAVNADEELVEVSVIVEDTVTSRLTGSNNDYRQGSVRARSAP